MNSIKDYRNKELLCYIVANVVTILLILKIIRFDNFGDFSFAQFLNIISTALVTSCISVFVFLFDSLIYGRHKDKIVDLWRKRYGEVVFSKIKNGVNDIRFTKEQVLRKYKKIYDNYPSKKSERFSYENSNWYSLYSKYKKIEMIYNSHRDYLLCRDINVSTYFILIIYVILSLFVDSIDFSWKCIFIELALLIITNIAARQKAKSFVYNVIAYDLQH